MELNQDIFIAIAQYLYDAPQYIMGLRAVCKIANQAMDKAIPMAVKEKATACVRMSKFTCHMRVRPYGGVIEDLLTRGIGSRCRLSWGRVCIDIMWARPCIRIDLMFDMKPKGDILINTETRIARVIRYELNQEAAEYIMGLTMGLFPGFYA